MSIVGFIDIASRWLLPCRKCLSLGSGTDVKSLATFSSGPDPSERPRLNACLKYCSLGPGPKLQKQQFIIITNIL